MSPLILSEFSKTGQKGSPLLCLSITNKSKLSINNYIKQVRRKYWKALFHNKKFIGKLTNNLQQEYYQMVEDLKEYDFSLYNINQIKFD